MHGCAPVQFSTQEQVTEVSTQGCFESIQG